MSVDNLSLNEAALKVGGDEVDATHTTPKAGSKSEESSSRRMSERC